MFSMTDHKHKIQAPPPWGHTGFFGLFYDPLLFYYVYYVYYGGIAERGGTCPCSKRPWRRASRAAAPYFFTGSSITTQFKLNFV